MGIHRANTTAYHPQTDGLVERFNRTLLDMLAKTAHDQQREWDLCLPFVLFAYRCSPQASTGESPFFLMYGRDPRLPTEAALSPPESCTQVDLDDYKTTVVKRMSEAWQMAQKKIVTAQNRQSVQHDRHARPSKFCPGDRVFIFNPAMKSGRAHKLSLPFQGPYRITSVYDSGLEVRPIDRSDVHPIRVAFDRVRRCPLEIPDMFSSRRHHLTHATPTTNESEDINVWRGKLRSKKNEAVAQEGEM